jgi:hypothetical protein
MQMDQLKDQIKDLVAAYGPDKVETVIQAALNRPKVPADYIRVLSPQALADSVIQLDAGAQDIIEKGKDQEAAYDNKAGLLKQKLQLETEIDLSESEALMAIRGEGKDAYAMVGQDKVSITNDKTRDAYRKMASAEQRKQLAEVEGKLAALDIARFKASDAWNTAKEASDKVQAKAQLQAALLNFLA